MEIEITCGNKSCVWTFTVTGDAPTTDQWICPKCGTDQSHKRKACKPLELPEDLDPDLAEVLKEEGWTLWPPQMITEVRHGSVVKWKKNPDK